MSLARLWKHVTEGTRTFPVFERGASLEARERLGEESDGRAGMNGEGK